MDATERDPPGRARRNLVNGSMDVLGMQLEGVGDAHGADPISFAPRTFSILVAICEPPGLTARKSHR